MDRAKLARLRSELDLELLGAIDPDLAGTDPEFLEREAICGNMRAVYTLALTADAANRLLEAERWFTVAAEQQDVSALHNLGIYAFESGDLAGARHLWDQAAGCGCVPASDNLAAMDRHADGRPGK